MSEPEKTGTLVGWACMNPNQMKDRTKAFGLRIIRLVEALPATRIANVIGTQVLRSGTSVGSNYRSARRARSDAEFLAKLGIVEEESDETAYWLEMLGEAKIVSPKRLEDLMKECNEITAIVVATIKTTKRGRK
jgi:four helix bundle protein